MVVFILSYNQFKMDAYCNSNSSIYQEFNRVIHLEENVPSNFTVLNKKWNKLSFSCLINVFYTCSFIPKNVIIRKWILFLLSSNKKNKIHRKSIKLILIFLFSIWKNRKMVRKYCNILMIWYFQQIFTFAVFLYEDRLYTSSNQYSMNVC